MTPPPPTPPTPPTPTTPTRLSAHNRADGAARLSVKPGPRGVAVLDDLWRRGAAKLLFPRVYDDPLLEATLINSAGGLTGGDRLSFDFHVASGAGLRVTTPGAEKVWRALPDLPPAELRVAATAAPGAALEWLPQETILFDQAALRRRLEIDLQGDATLTLAETLVLGRQAMGERIAALRFSDWLEIRRDGRPLLIETARLDGPLESLLNHRAALAGAVGYALLARAAADAEALLDPVRAALDAVADPGLRAAASAWNGLLVARFLATDAMALRRGVAAALQQVRGRPAPRCWMI